MFLWVIKKKRGTKFKLADVKLYVDVANKMKAEGDQSQAVFDLHIDSINGHGFEEIFLPQSHGYRPNTDAHAAVGKEEPFLEKGYHRVLDADIEGFFDHVNHQIFI
jgi:hypothetical protein